MGAADLSLRSDIVALMPAPNATPVLLLVTEARSAAWRLIEAFSIQGNPFELELQWSAGSGSGASARVTVPSATRLCIFAKTLTLRALDLSGKAQSVGVTVADGFDPTRNVWTYQGEIGGGLGGIGSGGNPDIDVPLGDGDVDVDIDAEPIALIALPRPAFGRHLRVQISKPERLGDVSLELRGAHGRVIAVIPGAMAMESGVALGGAAGLFLRTPAPMAFRAIYELAL